MARSISDHVTAAGLKATRLSALAVPADRRRAVNDAADRAWELRHLVPAVPAALRAGYAPRATLLTHPAVPSRNQLVTKIALHLGYRIHGAPDGPHDLAQHTMKTRGVCDLPEATPTVNRACTDVSKGHVAAVFERVFGYALAVDPTTHEGRIVEKSESNSAHDGRILDGPLAPGDVAPGKVYQRFVEATTGTAAVDFRTALIDGQIPVVIEKHRPEARRFENFQNHFVVHDPASVYSDDEREKLTALARALGLDFGEMDVLRDADGRLYVVDVNNRPASPAKELPVSEQRRILATMAAPFREMVRRLSGRG